MFISNIISKLPTISYKLEIIYKATTTPTNKDQHPCSTNINIGSIKSLYMTCSHTQNTSSITTYTCFTLLTHILTWASNSFALQVPLSIKDTSPSWCVKFGTPLNHVHPDVPLFCILVRTFDTHCGAAVKHTPWPLVNPLTFIHG